MALNPIVIVAAFGVHEILATPRMLEFGLLKLFFRFEIPAALSRFVLLSVHIVQADCSDHTVSEFAAFLDVVVSMSAPRASRANRQGNFRIFLSVQKRGIDSENIRILNLPELWLFVLF